MAELISMPKLAVILLIWKKGKEFEDGKLTLEDVVAYTKANGEPKQTSGKQELYEAILNMYC